MAVNQIITQINAWLFEYVSARKEKGCSARRWVVVREGAVSKGFPEEVMFELRFFF